MEREDYKETYSVHFEGEQYLVVLSPFADVGTLVAQVIHTALGREVVDLDEFALLSSGFAINMHTNVALVWGESNELRRVEKSAA